MLMHTFQNCLCSLNYKKYNFFRHLYKWVERLKKELPYYDDCNTGIVENQ